MMKDEIPTTIDQKVIRVVRLTFHHDFVPSFLTLMKDHAVQIRQFSGCEKLKFLRDADRQNRFYTHSIWTSTGHLEAYRNSALFQSIWSQTKLGFCEKPLAWSAFELATISPEI